ncbi:MAG: peptide deformylase, partial [Clostridia bacterium]|nr:peptide deformylase [Clostridia bacterium]
MAILQIIDDSNEVLRKKCREVTEITPRILTLLDDMADTLHKANGVGLAAPQVGVLRRVVLVETEPGTLYELI